MSSSDPAKLAEQGQAALNAQNYTQAIEHYSAALAGSPTSVDYYIKRSTAYQRAQKYKEALSDAELAVHLAHKRGARELIGTAQLRRGITYVLMEQYGDAGMCFEKAQTYNPAEKSIGFWQKKLEMELGKTDEDDVRREVTVKEIPDVVVPKKTTTTTTSTKAVKESRIEELPDDHVEEKKNEHPVSDVLPTPAVPAPVEGVVIPQGKIRTDHYQTGTTMVISLLVKGVPKDKATVEFQKRSVSYFSLKFV